jgi:hypothetical protein
VGGLNTTLEVDQRVKRVVSVAAVVAALAVVVVAPVSASHSTRAMPGPGTWCGGNLWRLMTLSDAQRWRVYPVAIRTTIPAVAALAAPKRIVAYRNSTAFEQQVWAMKVVIERYRLQSNGEIALQLYDIPSATYMNAYMPNPSCLSPIRAISRTKILAARSAFTKACPAATPAWQLLGATVELAGVGFWNPVKTTPGALRNGAELRPITHFSLIQGCGKYG